VPFGVRIAEGLFCRFAIGGGLLRISRSIPAKKLSHHLIEPSRHMGKNDCVLICTISQKSNRYLDEIRDFHQIENFFVFFQLIVIHLFMAG